MWDFDGDGDWDWEDGVLFEEECAAAWYGELCNRLDYADDCNPSYGDADLWNAVWDDALCNASENVSNRHRGRSISSSAPARQQSSGDNAVVMELAISFGLVGLFCLCLWFIALGSW
ncbi:hypothetical protein ACFLYO_08375 [Chloroflexota bacterium]